MSPIRLRRATAGDVEAVASLHAESWRTNFRGIYRDAYLDHGVYEDRLSVWHARLSDPPPNQYVVLARRADQLIGFACAYGGEDETWGSFLDNLHVRPGSQGHGVGATLMADVAAWCRESYPSRGLYLWVLEQNHGAQRFYRRLGASDRGGEASEAPGGGQIRGRRYAWADVADIPAA